MINYLIELSVIHSMLFLGYWLFLRKERQYANMRFTLLGSTFLALTIPLLKLPKLLLGSTEPLAAIPIQAISLDAITIAPSSETSFWSFDQLIWVYATISGFFLVKFAKNVRYLMRLERGSTYEKFNGMYIRRTQNIKGSFSFFNWIFLSNDIDKSEEDYQVILKHEKAHVSMRHSYDLVFFELFKVCFWWLPSAWLIIKEMKKIHEYQADAHVLKSFDLDQYSTILITSTLKLNGLVGLASSFHDGLIIKRLKAMKQNAKNVRPWKWGILSSMFLILLVVFACSEEADIAANETGSLKSSMEEVFTVVEEVPQYPGGIDALYKHVATNITYPKEARVTGVEGVVDVQFVVERNGSLSEVKVVKGIGAGCDEEAVNVLQNAAPFKPGSQRGRTVRVRMVMPIEFKLDPEKTNKDNSAQGMVIVNEVQQKNETLKINSKFEDGEWSGTIYDANGNVLPGASIVVAGTTRGTVSDLDGSFKVKADKSKDLHISFVGYETVKLESK
ncbi:TonB family protein [Flammeovirgaceae bacterium SG7u.111]|nr:TonB family protein [Flammeovirgaceae bacterium SG7u.132]WPO33776.1 TonB family protein [Flammeovirgaceae bacterium SG7u.111]